MKPEDVYIEPMAPPENGAATESKTPRARATERLRRAIVALADRCDHASSEDGQGFSRDDQGDGHALADMARRGDPWSSEDAGRAYKLARKYQRQLGELGFPPTSITDPRMVRDKVVRILRIDELLSLTPAGWIVERFLLECAFHVVYGKPGDGKSFLVLDWGLCVAAGIDWHGARVKPLGVAYIAAEGSWGLNPRVRAWARQRGVDPRTALTRFYTVPDPLAVTVEPEMDAFREALDELPELPSLVIVDTLGRTIIPQDENSAQDMGLYVRALDRLREEGMAVIVVHHMTKDGKAERGSTALRGAADAMFEVQLRAGEFGAGKRLILKCSKLKDAEPPPDVSFGFEVVELSDLLDENEQPRTTCVLKGRQDYSSDSSDGSRKKGYSPEYLLRLLLRNFDEDGASNTDWKKVYMEPGQVAESTYHAHKKFLVEKGYVKKRKEGKCTRFTPTDEGKEWLGEAIAPNSSE